MRQLDHTLAPGRGRLLPNGFTAFFLEHKLLNERLARNMLDWTHSGFSVDASILIPAGSAQTREALNTKAFPPVEFLVELLQHLPDSRRRLIRTCGLYSSRARGTRTPCAALGATGPWRSLP